MLKNAFSQILEKAASTERVNAAKERFAFKPFHERNKALHNVAIAARFVFPAISILLACYYVATLIYAAIPIFSVSVLLGVVLLSLLEVAKAATVVIAVETIYSSSRTPYLLIFAALLFACVSGFASVRGAMELHNKHANELQSVEAAHANELQSIENAHAVRIGELEARIAGIEKHKTKRWGGLLSGSENTQIINLQNEIERTHEAHAARMAAVKAKQGIKAAMAAENNGFNLYAFALLALLIDVAILLAGWYVVYYDYRTAKESEQLSGGGEISVNVERVNEFLHYVNGYTNTPFPAIGANTETQQSIGFKGVLNSHLNGLQGTETHTHTHTTQSTNERLHTHEISEKEIKELREFLAKYETVVKAVKSGATNMHAANIGGCSISTVHNVKRCLRTLGEI